MNTSNATDVLTTAWFERMRRRCVDHYRALASIELAHKYAFKLHDGWDYLDDELQSSLHVSSVVAYTRPFTSAKTAAGKVQYPVRDLKREPGFDSELHEHLLKIRDRLIAHSDYGLLRSTMYMQSVGNPPSLPVSLGINVKRMVGIEDRHLAERYVRHFSSCVTRIARRFDDEFNSLGRSVRDKPEIFGQTSNLPLVHQSHGPIPSLRPLPSPHGPAGDVQEPDFVEELAGYKYERLTHQRALIKSGTYNVSVDGKPEQYTFDIKGPDIDH